MKNFTIWLPNFILFFFKILNLYKRYDDTIKFLLQGNWKVIVAIG